MDHFVAVKEDRNKRQARERRLFCGTHLSSFFTLPISSKCLTTVVWLTLRSLDSSREDFRGLSSTSDFKSSLLTLEGRPVRS